MAKTFVQLLVEGAEKQLDKVAIVENDGAMQTTYGELISQARRVASYIHSKGIEPQSFVAVKLNDGRDYVIAELGIWFSRCVSVPLGVAFPQKRIDYIMEHCESPLILDDDAMAEAYQMEQADIIWPESDDNAMLIYTSGSTGNPKGILHTFTTMGNAFTRRSGLPRMSKDTQFGNYAPMYFVAKIGVYGCLLIGATAHFYSKEVRNNIDLLADYIHKFKISRSYIPPAALSLFKNKSEHLKYVTTGGEKLTTQYSKDGYQIINNFGMTETFASVAFFALPDHPMDSVPVGKMAEGIGYSIVDEEGNPVPEGEIGELCFHDHLCKEYYKDPEKTADLFRGGLMHTGDLVREQDGLIYYVQRKDWMVKINGQRVEPSEVEVVISRIEGVKSAVVKGFDSPDGSQYIVGYYILEEGATLTAEDITDQLSQKVPPYMVPRFMVEMQVFPINLNGKVDRKSLLSPEDKGKVSQNYVAPTNDTERQLCEAMAKVLGYEKLGIDDDFISLGADSIRIMKVQQMCPDLRLSSRLIHTYRTPKAIAAQLDKNDSVASQSATDNESSRTLTPQPLTQTQLGIYLECEKRQGQAVYNNPFLLRLEDSVDLTTLAKAIEIAIAAHPGVSTTIVEDQDGTPLLAMPQQPWAEPVCTIEQVSDEEFAALKPALQQPFIIKTDRLYRARIFQTPSGKYVFFDFHHIIFDGTSMHIFLADVSRAYYGHAVDAESYTAFDIAHDEQQDRLTDILPQAKEWYLSTFGESLEPSKPVPDLDEKETTFGHDNFALTMTAQELDAWCATHQVTANVLATAAFGRLLAAYTNADSALFATIYNGRSDMRTSRTMGMLVKTFPVSIAIDRQTTVAALLTATKQQMMGAMANDIYSFAELAAETGMTSDVMFVYQGDMHQVNNEETLKFGAEPLEFNATGEPLNVQMMAAADGTLTLDIQYHSNAYSADYIRRFANAYNTVLREMTLREKVSEVQLLTSEEQANIIAIGRGAILDYDHSETLVSMFRRQAAATPDAVAVVFQNKTLTYAQLDEQTDRLAAHLQSRGVGPETVVGVMITRSELMAIYPMAIMKAGAAYMPLDPDFPEDRLSFMIEDAGVKLILSTNGLVSETLPSFAGEIFEEREMDTLPAASASQLGAGPTPDSLMIILYTSGSTGKPKGVLLEQKSVVNFCHWYVKEFKMTSEDRSVAYANFGFDAHMMDIYPSYLAGATVHILDNEIRHDLDAMADYFNKNKTTIAFMTTQICCQMVSLFELPTMRLMSAGGEKMPPITPPAFDFYNGYGPTECSLFSTFYKVTGPFDGKIIGQPLDNYQLYVVDKYMNLVPLGVPGELVVSGVAVGRGYLNRPDVNADKFIDYLGAKSYRTGDEVRWTQCPERPVGKYDIEYFGRMDGQVKLRGLRIELGEVENAMSVFPGVQQAVAAVKEIAGSQHLCGYYVVAEGQTVDIDDMIESMRQNLTDFMIPEFFTQVETMPYNANGKVDRKRLPEPDMSNAITNADSDSDAHVWNTLELGLKEIIANLTGNDQLSISAPLRQYGLTSLLSMKLAVQIKNKYGVKLASGALAKGSLLDIENAVLDAVFNPTTSLNITPATPATAPATDILAPASAPLSYPQQGVYIDCIRNTDSTMYNIPFIMNFPEGIAAADIAAVVKATIMAHQSLSLVISNVDGVPTQMVKPFDIEVASDKVFATDEEYQQYKRTFIKPFNLAEGPLVHAEVVTCQKTCKLLFDVHHLVADGGSVNMIMQEILQRMEGITPEPETYTYTAYANQQNTDQDTQVFEDNKAFYAQQLKDFETASEIPADRNGKLEDGNGAEALAPIDMDAAAAFAQQLGVTPAALFLAATYYVVSRYTNSKNVYLGTISNGRSNLDIANTIGMFVSTLPLASHIEEQTVSQYIRETADNFAETINHENYPFTAIASDYGFAPNIMFEYQVGVLEQQTLNGKPITLEGFELEEAKFKTAIKIINKGISIGYNDALYTADTMMRMARCIAATVQAFIHSAEAKVKNISMLDHSAIKELDHIRQTCLDPEAVRFPLFHNCIEYWAEHTPDKTAIVACNETLTYRQFNEKANILAHSLINKGVKPGDRVCLLLPRKSWHLIAMFGVMKAGAAYIPCDPEYPAERINLITDDSHARFVITTPDKMEPYGNRALNVETLLNSTDNTSNPDITLITPNHLAYLIYTSGSTGRPKGVMLRHVGICNYLTDHEENRHFHALVNHCKTMLCITTVSFDLSLKEIGASLFNGMTLVMANEDQVNDPQSLSALMLSTGVDGFSGTPSRLKMFLDLPDFQKAFARCKFIVLGGEKYPPTLLPQIKELAPSARLFNTYGPTEISVSSNGKELTHADRITIGRPLLNVKEYVVDNDLNELPVGVTGELLIGGLGVSAGYNDLPDKTAEAFIEYNGERCYKSGDYAYWNADGEVIILGRKDHQIKLNGLRIELGEVETVLNKQPQIKEGVVMIKNVEGHDHLVAYYTIKEAVDIDTLKEQMGHSLTHYMIPTIFVEMEKMPISPNGKTDLKALPQPTMANREYVEPQNDAEKFFCECFATILERERVGATDNFFEIGGTSLIAMRVVMTAAKGGYKIVYKQVFDNPTPRALAELVGNGTSQPQPESKTAPSAPATSNEPAIINDGTDPEVQNYDYTQINDQLKKNNLSSLRTEQPRPLGTCIVTGATGYLGIHVVKELIDSPDVPAIYCMVRGNKHMSAESRLRTQLFYYFGNTFEELFGTRIFVIDGDVTKADCLASVPESSASGMTLFNCAANVKHFSAGTDIEDINIGGCQTCIDFCLRTGARLIQTSTHSIAGQKESTSPVAPDMITESRLYWGQKFGNRYAYAKFIAERNVLEAVVTKGLDAKIMRLGNLSARSTDGEFQINFTTNSFMGRLRAFQTIGCMPYAMSLGSIEFSPINEVAKAIILLASTPSDCTVYHPVNAHRQLFDNVITCLNNLGVKIDLVENDVYQQILMDAFADTSKAPILQSLMAYQPEPGKYVVFNGDNYDYTTQTLLRLGFRWNFTTWDYMERFITAIQGLGFFDDDYQR